MQKNETRLGLFFLKESRFGNLPEEGLQCWSPIEHCGRVGHRAICHRHQELGALQFGPARAL